MKLSVLTRQPGVFDGAGVHADASFDADVCVIGSGAGGAVAAATLAEAGLDVLLVEEGGHHGPETFDGREASALPRLYRESMQRTTVDGAIGILQGRAVGGSTLVNWATCLRTPEDVVAHWQAAHGVGFGYADLVPGFEWADRRLAVKKVDLGALNKNNQHLWNGCKALGFHAETVSRNVHGCQELGSCGLGCPTNAKRSTAVTLIPDALERGARLLHRARVDRLVLDGGRVVAAEGALFRDDGIVPSGRTFRIRARTFIVAAGAINGPGLLLRSGIRAGGRVGRRTFLHPALATLGLHDQPVESWKGAPQGVVSFEFARRGDDVGFVMECAPWYPSLAAVLTRGMGDAHAAAMADFVSTAVHIAITIDGFHDGEGGTVGLGPSGTPMLEYSITPRHWRALAFAQEQLARVAFAGGARAVRTVHEPPLLLRGVEQLGRLANLPWRTSSVALFSAHQMGGCAMGDDPATSVVRSRDLRMHDVDNLHVVDASVFPTAVGVNPQMTVFAVARLASLRMAEDLRRRPL